MKCVFLIVTSLIHIVLGENSTIIVRQMADNRLYYAHDAERNQFPFMCYITNCGGGGSIIAPTFILTAAHVIEEAHNFGRTARVDCDLALNRKLPGVSATSKNLYLHPGYAGQTAKNDIGIVELSMPLIFSASVQPVKLPSSNNNDYANRIATVCGFGQIGNFILISN